MIKFHIRLCIFCGKYNNQVIDNHTMCHHFKENEAQLNDTLFADDSLMESRKKALKAKIRETIESEQS